MRHGFAPMSTIKILWISAGSILVGFTAGYVANYGTALVF